MRGEGAVPKYPSKAPQSEGTLNTLMAPHEDHSPCMEHAFCTTCAFRECQTCQLSGEAV